MAYRRRRGYSRRNRDKYSVEQTGFSYAVPNELTNGLYQNSVLIVPPSTTQGMRKVKHLTVNLTVSSGTEDRNEIYWALVFVPQGYSVNPLFVSEGSITGSVYEPNQFVMNTGIVDPSAGPIRFRSAISRNLNSGDSIYLVTGTTADSTSTSGSRVFGLVRYAVTLQ